MASFNASKIAQEDGSPTSNRTGQCTPLPLPVLGTLNLEAGNGTSVGTVMRLQCPYKHRAVSGGLISCVQDHDGIQWFGGIPKCRQLTRYEDTGFQVALFASLISIAIIIFMSIIFITSCLLKCVRKEERRRLERERKREAAELWQHRDLEEQRYAFFYEGSHNNNNNNNNNQIRPKQLHPVPQSVHRIQPHLLSDLQATCRCLQQDYSIPPSTHHSQPHLESVSLSGPYINTQATCIPQPQKSHFPQPFPGSEYHSNLDHSPWQKATSNLVVTQEGGVYSMSCHSLENPFWKDLHPAGPQRSPTHTSVTLRSQNDCLF